MPTPEDEAADGQNEPPDVDQNHQQEEEGFHGFPDRHPSSIPAGRPRRERKPPNRLIQNMS